MSIKSIEIAGPDFCEEVTVSFKRQKDGFYKKIISKSRRDRKTNHIKELGDEELDDIYELVTTGDYDEKIAFFDIENETEDFLKLKLIKQ